MSQAFGVMMQFCTKSSSKSGVSSKAKLHFWTWTRFIYPGVLALPKPPNMRLCR
jgi:hypothetical protein